MKREVNHKDAHRNEFATKDMLTDIGGVSVGMQLPISWLTAYETDHVISLRNKWQAGDWIDTSIMSFVSWKPCPVVSSSDPRLLRVRSFSIRRCVVSVGRHAVRWSKGRASTVTLANQRPVSRWNCSFVVHIDWWPERLDYRRRQGIATNVALPASKATLRGTFGPRM